MAEKQNPQASGPSQAPAQNTSNFSATPPVPPPAQTSEWSNSLWDCCSPTETCLCGWCVPCFLFGKTSARLDDPSLQSDSYVNGNCCLFLAVGYCSLHWVVIMMKRGELRKRFGIQGSALEDCAGSYFCPCCTLVQNEKEVEARSKSIQVPYQRTEGMVYPQ